MKQPMRSRKRLALLLFGALLSCLMSLLVSGVSTLRLVGLGPDLLGLWLQNWLSAWLIAFPSVLLLAPMVQRLVALAIADDPP